MKFIPLVAIATASVTLGAQQPATTQNSAYRAARSMNSSEARFVQDALESGRRNVKLGEMALQKSLDSNVKDYAQRLITDQQSANKQLEQIEKEYGITDNYVPSANSPAYLANQERTSMNWTGVDPKTHSGRSRFPTVRLQNVNGAKFDQEFARLIVEDEQSSVSKYENARKTATNSDVQGFIDAKLPTIKEHLTQAQSLK